MDTTLIIYIYVFILGLLVGSFLNVCIYRIPKGESIISPPSHCTSCGKRLSPIDLIPVFSFLFLRGKCRYCKAKVSPRYAFVELLTACTFVLLLYKFNLTVDFAAFSYLMSILIAMFFIDLDHRIIPDGLVISGLIGGVFIIIYNIFYPMQMYNGDRTWWNPVVGMFAASGILFLIALIGLLIYKTDDAMGMGDVKIFAPIGIFLGWKMTLAALLFTVVLAGFISLFLILIGVKDRKSTIPLGPFIVLGTLTAIMYGWDILNWYIGSLG